MRVTIVEATKEPITMISLAAGCSTKREDVKYKRVERCIKDGHSVSEFSDIVFKIEGISRSCLAQLTRHRIASYCVESQRYNKYNLKGEDWYVIPPDIKNNSDLLEQYRKNMSYIAVQYEELLTYGIKAEDARFILPESTKTNLYMKMNARSLFNFLDLRLDSHSQWEIRELANNMVRAARQQGEEWNQLLDYYFQTKV